MDKRKFLKILPLFGILAIVLFLVGLFLTEITKPSESEGRLVLAPSKQELGECPIVLEERIVRGNSLAPLVKSGQTVRVLFGYYECNEIQRDDVVLYNFAGSKTPLIKIVRGVPGDSFKLEQTKRGAWHIIINGEVLKNSVGQNYLISGKRYEMLALYEKDFKGKIPAGAYLLLGNITSGATDSTRFGLVSKRDILGKAEH